MKLFAQTFLNALMVKKENNKQIELKLSCFQIIYSTNYVPSHGSKKSPIGIINLVGPYISDTVYEHFASWTFSFYSFLQVFLGTTNTSLGALCGCLVEIWKAIFVKYYKVSWSICVIPALHNHKIPLHGCVI